MISQEFLLMLFVALLVALIFSISITVGFYIIHSRNYVSAEEYMNQSLIYGVKMD